MPSPYKYPDIRPQILALHLSNHPKTQAHALAALIEAFIPVLRDNPLYLDHFSYEFHETAHCLREHAKLLPDKSPLPENILT